MSDRFDEETPKEAMESILKQASDTAMRAIRERNAAMIDMIGEMERGDRPLPPKDIRSFLLDQLREQITDCQGYEELAQSEKVKQLVKETTAAGVEALTRLQALFVKDGDVPTAN